jgi:hypothetical protein
MARLLFSLVGALVAALLLAASSAHAQSLTPSPGLKRLKNDVSRASKHASDGVGSATYTTFGDD